MTMLHPGVAVRPRLETLEAREVPATVIWTGAVDSDAWNEDNWDVGVVGSNVHDLPLAGDDVVFAPLWVSVPGTPGHPPHFELVSTDCTGFHGLAGAYASVTILSDYDATVTLIGGFTTGDLTLAGGTIDQPSPTSPYANTDITVTDDMVWTGTTLNSTSHLANLTITGEDATMLFAPTNGGGTLNCGSNLNFEDGATGTLKEGTLVVTNQGMEIDIEDDCTVEADPGQSKTVVIDKTQDVTFGGQLNVKAAGSLFRVVTGMYDSVGPAKITAGRIIVKSDPNGETAYGARFSGHVDQEANGPCFKQTGGTTFIATNASLGTLDEGTVLIAGGSLCFQPGNSPSYIDAKLKVTAGDIISYDNASGGVHLFAELLVNGDVEWTGGTYHPFVSTVDNYVADLWSVNSPNGTFSISGTAAVAPSGVDGQNSPATPGVNAVWRLFEIDGMNAGITAAANTPSPTAGWAFEKQMANPCTWWDLKHT